MNVLEAIAKRHSYRGAFKPDPVPREDLVKIMQAGLDAPSGCNKQTTSLIAIDEPELLKKVHSVIDPPVGETAPATWKTFGGCAGPAMGERVPVWRM